ncbi:MAG: GIY-YIG nuclease family protein [bacterium]|nr:GIY-YIG nuclease family protein [bacterium]
MSTSQLVTKLKELPDTPGVYFHKNADGEIIYIGKAAVLKNRVRQYFQKSRSRDAKTDALVAEIADLEWIEVETEIDALFLEAEMIRRYMPPYNILLRDDKSLSFVRIDFKSDVPMVTMTRRPLDDGAEYFGPFVSSYAVKKALRYLRRIFPFYGDFGAKPKLRKSGFGRSKLYQQIGLEPDIESPEGLAEYRSNLRRLVSYIKGNRVQLINELENEMKSASKLGEFERAALARNRLFALKDLTKQIIFSDREFLDISKDEGLAGLANLLGLSKIPRRIEGFDISHMSGTDTVASMVVFSQGIPEKSAYRKFKMRHPGNDDFAHTNEVIRRRISEKNIKQWGLPDIFLIDGGKGQLSAAWAAQNEALGLTIKNKIPMIGLAKKEEEIVIKLSEIDNSEKVIQTAKNLEAYIRQSEDFLLIELPKNSHIVKLLQRIRDESHRFAVSYHSTLKRSRQTVSWLDEVPTIGPLTRKKLIRQFGSVRAVVQARNDELITSIGPKKAAILKQYIRASKKGNA